MCTHFFSPPRLLQVLSRNPLPLPRRRPVYVKTISRTVGNQQRKKPQKTQNPQQHKQNASFEYRANALLTFVVTILVLMCAMASFSDNFNHPSPSAHVEKFQDWNAVGFADPKELL